MRREPDLCFRESELVGRSLRVAEKNVSSRDDVGKNADDRFGAVIRPDGIERDVCRSRLQLFYGLRDGVIKLRIAHGCHRTAAVKQQRVCGIVFPGGMDFGKRGIFLHFDSPLGYYD